EVSNVLNGLAMAGEHFAALVIFEVAGDDLLPIPDEIDGDFTVLPQQGIGINARYPITYKINEPINVCGKAGGPEGSCLVNVEMDIELITGPRTGNAGGTLSFPKFELNVTKLAAFNSHVSVDIAAGAGLVVAESVFAQAEIEAEELLGAFVQLEGLATDVEVTITDSQTGDAINATVAGGWSSLAVDLDT